MGDLEHANSLLRMAHKNFNALVGMQENSLFADEIFGFHVCGICGGWLTFSGFRY